MMLHTKRGDYNPATSICVNMLNYACTEKEIVEEPLYTSVREYLKDYDFSGLSDEGFENAVYESPILYARRIGLGKGKVSEKPYALLLAHEDEKFEWRSNGVIVWFELKKRD